MPEWPSDDWAKTRLKNGFQPKPFTQLILKMHSRCNLACDYCYIYELSDSSWRDRSVRISRDVITQCAKNFRSHCASHEVGSVSVTFHGGEPLLAGIEMLDYAAHSIRQELEPEVKVRFSVQTNGTLITKATAEVLSKHQIRVGISLDGSGTDNDKHRRYRNGKGSFARVMRGLDVLRQPEFVSLYRGILCTVNLENDPMETYRALLELEPPMIDFLLPHGTWSDPPPGIAFNDGSRRPADSTTLYADWLIPIYDDWFFNAPTHVRFFSELTRTALGASSRVETIGVGSVQLVVVETDGTIEQVDSLKSTFDGAAATGMNIFDNSFDDVLTHPMIMARQVGIEALSEQCLKCDVRDMCGGGYFPHRYRAEDGFRNPSVFCADLYKLASHVRRRVDEALAAARSDLR